MRGQLRIILPIFPLSLMEMNWRRMRRRRQDELGETYEALRAAEDVGELETGVAYGGSVDDGCKFLGREAARQNNVTRDGDCYKLTAMLARQRR